jgi:hypothetical protein
VAEFVSWPAFLRSVGRLGNDHDTVKPKECRGSFRYDSRGPEGPSSDYIGKTAPVWVMTDVCRISRRHRTAFVESESEHEAPEKVRAGCSALDHTQHHIRPLPANHETRYSPARTEIYHESRRDLATEPFSHSKGPLSCFAERALSNAFFQRGEQQRVVRHEMLLRPVQ